jgi:uncharacterized RDD family membrane protein YckC
MSEGWYIDRGGERYGPYSEDQLREFARGGTLGASDQVWNPATSAWQTAGQVPGLVATTAPGTFAAPPPAPGTAVGGDAAGVGIGPRLVATLIDLVILAVVIGVIVAAFGDTTTTTSDDSFSAEFDLGAGGTLLVSVAAFSYYWLMEAFLGATVGKLVVGLRVRSLDGGPVGLGQAAIRTVLRIIDGLFFYLVAALVVAATPKNQRIGDLAAKTVVVRR